MSAEEFWKDDPQLFVSYRTSFINKKKRELEEVDYKSWLMGLYVHDGNSKLSLTLRQFLGNIIASFAKKQKDLTKIEEYPKKPYSELNKDKERETEIKKQTKKIMYENYNNSLIYFGSMKQRYLENLKNKKGE